MNDGLFPRERALRAGLAVALVLAVWLVVGVGYRNRRVPFAESGPPRHPSAVSGARRGGGWLLRSTTWTYQASAAPSDVHQFYQSTLAGQGWQATVGHRAPQAGVMVRGYRRGRWTLEVRTDARGEPLTVSLLATDLGPRR